MQRIASVTPSRTRSLIRAVTYISAALVQVVCMGVPVTAAELRPYSLPSQNMDNAVQYQQRRIVVEKVDESFYDKFVQDSKKYDAKKKAKTTAYLKDKLKKSSTEAELNHYSRLLKILQKR